jgi:hypothetical protein
VNSRILGVAGGAVLHLLVGVGVRPEQSRRARHVAAVVSGRALRGRRARSRSLVARAHRRHDSRARATTGSRSPCWACSATRSTLGCTYVALRHLASGVGAIVASTNPLDPCAGRAVAAARAADAAPRSLGMLLGLRRRRLDHDRAHRDGEREPARRRARVRRRARPASRRRSSSSAGAPISTCARSTRCSCSPPAWCCCRWRSSFEGTSARSIWSWELIVSFWYVVLVMSLGASLLWFWLLTHGEASRVSAYYFLTPVFGLGTRGAVASTSRSASAIWAASPRSRSASRWSSAADRASTRRDQPLSQM